MGAFDGILKTLGLKKGNNKPKDPLTVPKTVQQSIPYKGAYENGIIQVDNDTFSKMYRLSDLNFAIESNDEQKKIFGRFMEFISSFGPEVHIQTLIYNKSINNADLEQNILIPLRNDQLNEYREEMNDMLISKMSEARNNIVHEKYVIFSTKAEDIENAKTTFARLDAEVAKSGQRLTGTEAEVVPIEERLQIMHSIYNLDSPIPLNQRLKTKSGKYLDSFSLKDTKKLGLTTKDLIGPSAMEFSFDHFRLGDVYGRSLFLCNLPSFLRADVLTELSNMPFNMLSSVHYRVLPQDAAIRLIKERTVSINSNVVDQQKKASRNGYSADLISPEIRNSAAEVEGLMRDLTQDNQKIFMTSVVMTVFAEDMEQLDKNTEILMSTAERFVCQAKKLSAQQELGLNSCLPIGKNFLSIERLLNTRSAAIFVPFSVKELLQKGGMYYGLNAVSKQLILYNRLTAKNGNGCILGTPGCVDAETEFFNGEKWKPISGYEEGEKVLQFDPDTGEASLVRPQKYIKAPCEEMICFRSIDRDVDQMLSDEHRVLYYDYDFGRPMEMAATEFAEKISSGEMGGMIRTGFDYDGPGVCMEDYELKLMLIAIAKGIFPHPDCRTKRCKVSLTNSRLKNDLYEFLTDNDIQFSLYEASDGRTVYLFNTPETVHDFKKMMFMLSRRQINRVAETILKWFGNNSMYVYFGHLRIDFDDIEILDFIQFALTVSGYNAVMVPGDKSIEVYPSKQFAKTESVYCERVKVKDGFKYCFTVPTHALILRRNGRIFITGNSGKSFSAKREIVSVLLNTEDDVFVIDPENEYSELAKLFYGSVIRLAPGADVHINPMDMNIDYADSDDPVTLKADFVASLCEAASGSRYPLSPTQRTVIDRATKNIYAGYVEQLRMEGKSFDEETVPTLKDLYEELRMQPEPEAQNMALTLERFVTGTQDSFAYKTNVDVTNRFTVYNIKDIGTGMKAISLQICLDNIWNRMIENFKKGKRTWLYCDEFHLLVQTEVSARYTQQIWKRARKWKGIPTGITQQAEDMLKTPESRAIIMNSDFIMMLNLDPYGRSQLQQMFEISPTELEYVTSAGPGQGLIYNGTDRIPFVDDFPRDTKLYKAMTTKPDERVLNE